ncbi:MAG: DPP IV N-terminal domain-containing protein, partial [Chitinophagales bacterium]|nr:DPP IV N-terminal domain-containing protein [Chitinophagales bacterium]
MKQLILFSFMVLFATEIQAQQKKNITSDQAFRYAEPRLYKSPPAFEWLDASHYLMQRVDGNESENKQFVVDANNGKSIESTDDILKKYAKPSQKEIISKENDLYLKDGDVETRLTNDAAEEKNATLSPDNKFVAFTKNNNLFTIELSTKKINQLTNDGSDVILNGYLSWVYMEEILGRSTRYKAFWWSPDSKMLSFYRTDDSPVPI